jgi:hypothetical protein
MGRNGYCGEAQVREQRVTCFACGESADLSYWESSWTRGMHGCWRCDVWELRTSFPGRTRTVTWQDEPVVGRIDYIDHSREHCPSPG